MTLANKAERYAKQHPQEVTLAWVDNSSRTYTADKAVRLCAVPRIAACIMGAEAPDKALADMLNQMLDDCQRQFEIVRKRRRNFVVFRQGG